MTTTAQLTIADTAEFVEFWQTAESLEAVCGRFGLTKVQATRKAAKIRRNNPGLKRFARYLQAGPSLAKTYQNEDPDWQSPEWVVEAARALLDEVDLDPASSEDANQTVGAQGIFTEDDDGLKQSWDLDRYPSRVFLNPPGRWVLEFWDKLIEEWDANRVLSAFWVGFNTDHLRWLATRPKHPLGFYVCFPRSRIKFVRGGGVKGLNRPSCGNYLVWLPDEDCNENWARFCEVMGKYGRCIRGSSGFYSGEPYVKHPYIGVTPVRKTLGRSIKPSSRTNGSSVEASEG